MAGVGGLIEFGIFDNLQYIFLQPFSWTKNTMENLVLDRKLKFLNQKGKTASPLFTFYKLKSIKLYL